MIQVQALNVLAVSGLSPAVVTETLWALLVTGHSIASVTIITTRRGADLVARDLTRVDGAIPRLFADFDAARPMPPVQEIVVRGADGDDLADIAAEADHLAMSDAINVAVRDLTRDGQPALHASIAGGRKSMSAALTLAMCLHARPEDRLSHVLVPEEFERTTGFFYPLEPGSVSALGLRLVDLPFPRLRSLLPSSARTESMDRLIAALQLRLDAGAVLVVDLERRALHLPSGPALCLPPLQCAVYALLAVHAPADSAGLSVAELDLETLGQLYRATGASPEVAAELIDRLGAESPQPWLLEQFARLRTALRRAWGPAGVTAYGINRTGGRPATRYRLALPRSRLEIRPPISPCPIAH